MKKILLGAFIALTTLVTSCGSKDNDAPTPPEKSPEIIKDNDIPTPPQKSPEIIGVWQMESSTIDGKQELLPYTLSGNTFTTKNGTTSFTITEGKLVIEGAHIDVDGNKKPSTTTYKRITEKELASLRAMEYKAP